MVPARAGARPAPLVEDLPCHAEPGAADVSGTGPGHVGPEGAADRRPATGDGRGARAAQGLAAASGLVGAGPGRLDRRLRDGARQAGGRAGAGAGAGHRAVGTHARGDAGGRGRQRAAALHPVERHPRPRGGGGDGRRAALARDHRQHRLSRLHRAEARLGADARAGGLRQGRARCCCPRTTCGCG